MKLNEIQYVSFWHRMPDAVDKIERCRFDFPEGKWKIETENGVKEGVLDQNEKEGVFIFLNDTIHLEEDLEEYRAFDYENDPNQYSLSFFLKVLFRNKTYFAVKGCSPRKEKHFREILDYFGKLIQEKDKEIKKVN